MSGTRRQRRIVERHVRALESRVDELELLVDQRDIEQLMYRYIEACDHVRQADTIASMFTEDAVWEGANRYVDFGVTHGRAAIRAMFADTPDTLPFTVHWLTNAVVEVAPDRRTATGRWEVVQAATFAAGGETPVWVSARYDNEYRKTEQGWRIHHLRYADVFVTPYDGDGWTSVSYVSPLTGERTPA